MPSLSPDHYYTHLAACFCRGRLALALDTPDAEALALGERAGLRLFKWKRNAELPRVRRVLGVLRAFAPERLLDVGSGRGTFLWPHSRASCKRSRPRARVPISYMYPPRKHGSADTGRASCVPMTSNASRSCTRCFPDYRYGEKMKAALGW